MRKLLGWRFLIAIALPILLASLGVLSLTTDLLDRASATADKAESIRNREIVQRELKALAQSLGNLAQQNAQWGVAHEHSYPDVDRHWFMSTWGSQNALGKSYDVAAIVEQTADQPLVSVGQNTNLSTTLSTYAAQSWHAAIAGLQVNGPSQGYATTFLSTPDGPAVMAVSPILENGASSQSPPVAPRYLMLIHVLGESDRSAILSFSAMRDVKFSTAVQQTGSSWPVKNFEGQTVFSVLWKDVGIAVSATAETRQKATMVLGFLMLVMGGIAVVCWRLLQNVVANEEQAVHQALHDPLTGLQNRSAMIERLRDMSKSPAASYAVAYADLDGFKDVNDNFGHQVGDQLLRAVGAGIASLCNGQAAAFRMGGDEFVVLFEGDEAHAKAQDFSRHLLLFLAKPFDLSGRIAFVSASIGIALSDGQNLDELEILRRADIAMYKAKADGKNRNSIYEPNFDLERAEAQSIARELLGFIEQKAIDIAFQPVIHTHDMRVSGVEALARWPKTSDRHVTPDRFVTVAESAGLVDDLGELIFEKACAAAKAWPDLRLAVNISAVQLNNPHFVERVLAIIARHGISTRRIEMEITETSLIRDADRAKLVFKELQRHGIKIALDDFGTGFSSIGYLRTFNFDRIKIDKSIINKVLSNPAELAIVQGTLLVARGLSAEVTAEGVESDSEAAVLKLAGCTELQGYYFHKPMSADAVTALLESRARKSALRAAG
jgi:diguanylate cyclase (GGDEF)-like protein